MRLLPIVFIIFFYNLVNANEIRSIVKVNNYSITNIDLIKEIAFNEILRKRKLNNTEKEVLLSELIEEKIKSIETDKNNIKVKKIDINNRVTQIIQNYKIDEINQKQIREYIFNKVEIAMKWNKLIAILYSKKLEVNMNEIEEKMKIKKIDSKKKEEIIQIEKTKKINIISNTFYNEIKRKYLIKNIK